MIAKGVFSVSWIKFMACPYRMQASDENLFVLLYSAALVAIFINQNEAT
jgi:hypothetical protein